MLRHIGERTAAQRIENAIDKVMLQGVVRTGDLGVTRRRRMSRKQSFKRWRVRSELMTQQVFVLGRTESASRVTALFVTLRVRRLIGFSVTMSLMSTAA